MSDGSQGPGWWRASDGKWYPPESAPPGYVPTEPTAGLSSKSGLFATHRALKIAGIVIIVIFVLAAIGAATGKKKTTLSASTTRTTTEPRITAPATTSPPTTGPPATRAATTRPPTTHPPTTILRISPPTTKPQPKVTSPPPSPPPTESQAAVVAGYESQCQPVTVSHLANDPANYDGTAVTFTGTLVSFVLDSSGNPTDMNVSDPSDPTSIILVNIGAFADPTQMNKGDTLTIWGDGAGTTQGTNGFGGKINESTVSEVYLTDTTTGYRDDSDSSPT